MTDMKAFAKYLLEHPNAKIYMSQETYDAFEKGDGDRTFLNHPVVISNILEKGQIVPYDSSEVMSWMLGRD